MFAKHLFPILMGVLLFCLPMTPSLLPRPPLLQGVLSGIVFAVGFGLGTALMRVWQYLELPRITERVVRPIQRLLALVVLLLLAITFARAQDWQNSVRALYGMDAVDAFDWAQVVAVALGLSIALILTAQLLAFLLRRINAALGRFLSRRFAALVGPLVLALLLLSLIDGFILKRALSGMDQTFALLDRSIDENVEAPTVATHSGSAASLLTWEDIGRTGKNFLARSPDAAAISEVTGRAAMEPVRVYAGFNSADTLEKRAELALADLIRAGGFERATLIVATPTGTGWMDPAALDPLVHILGGDVAIVATQYSYLPSWLTLIVDPDRSRRSARALFSAVYSHWTSLPQEARPKLYLFGLSLGALGSEASADLITLIDDPIDGALWAGPPFASRVWPQIVDGRAEGSPAWRPRFKDGRVIRFMNRDGVTDPVQGSWSRMRFIYLQHPSDPMSFFV